MIFRYTMNLDSSIRFMLRTSYLYTRILGCPGAPLFCSCGEQFWGLWPLWEALVRGGQLLNWHKIWPEQTSLRACTLCACMLGPISQPNCNGTEISKHLWNQVKPGQTFLSTSFTPSTQAGMHSPYVLVCTGPYLNQIGMDQRDLSIYGIRRSCWTSLST